MRARRGRKPIFRPTAYDHLSPDEAARWALGRAQEERTRKVRVRAFWWTAAAAAIVFTAFMLAVTVLLAQDNPEAGILTEEEFQAVLAGVGSIPVGTILTDEQFERFAARVAAEVEDDDELRQALARMWLAVTDDLEEVQQGAEQGHATGQFRLGLMYDTGEGVPQDEAEAARWYRLAAEQGDAGAQNNLGLSYARGEGVLKDSVLAHTWFNIAGANGKRSRPGDAGQPGT